MDEVNELAARIVKLPDDAQYALAWRVLKGLGYQTPEEQAARQAKWEAEARAEIDAILAWEGANGVRPGGYRAAG
ncbi:MAG TPA: hypothetical protein VD866_00705 [Urbifossiella sp.]|nr:hypothetical protein [Urbifossiella sp.]